MSAGRSFICTVGEVSCPIPAVSVSWLSGTVVDVGALAFVGSLVDAACVVCAAGVVAAAALVVVVAFCCTGAVGAAVDSVATIPTPSFGRCTFTLDRLRYHNTLFLQAIILP